MAGMTPVTTTLVIVVGAAGVELQADKNRAATATGRNRTSERNQPPFMAAP
jgi:hypothetical protein